MVLCWRIFFLNYLSQIIAEWIQRRICVHSISSGDLNASRDGAAFRLKVGRELKRRNRTTCWSRALSLASLLRVRMADGAHWFIATWYFDILQSACFASIKIIFPQFLPIIETFFIARCGFLGIFENAIASNNSTIFRSEPRVSQSVRKSVPRPNRNDGTGHFRTGPDVKTKLSAAYFLPDSFLLLLVIIAESDVGSPFPRFFSFPKRRWGLFAEARPIIQPRKSKCTKKASHWPPSSTLALSLAALNDFSNPRRGISVKIPLA